MERTKIKIANEGMTDEVKKKFVVEMRMLRTICRYWIAKINKRTTEAEDIVIRFSFFLYILLVYVGSLDCWSVVHLSALYMELWSCWTLSHSLLMCECVWVLNGDIITRMDIWLCWFHFEQFYFHFNFILFFFSYIYIDNKRTKKTCLYQKKWLQEQKKLETCYALASQIKYKIGLRCSINRTLRIEHREINIFYCSFCVCFFVAKEFPFI